MHYSLRPDSLHEEIKYFRDAKMEGKNFIISMEGKSVVDALQKIMKQKDTMEGADILCRKEGIITFIDQEKRSVGDLLGVIDTILERDPRFKDPNYKLVGVFEVGPGQFIFFGKGEE